MFPELLLSVIIVAFVLEFFDASLGMGYGTTLTPLLLLLGFDFFLVNWRCCVNALSSLCG